MATLFDLDGTVLDPCGSIELTLQTMMQRHNFAPLRPEAEGLIGMPLRDILRTRTGDQQLIESMVHEYRELFFEVGAKRVTPYAGMIDLIASLPANRAVVTTKGEEEAIRLLKEMQLLHLFDVVIGDDDLRPTKPDPAPVHAALASLDVDASEATMIGDTRFDVEAGNRAGCRTIAVTWGSGSLASLQAAAPDHTVHSVQELRALLATI